MYKRLTNLEVVDGVGRGKPGGARVLLGAEGPIEGLGDGTQVEGTHCRCCNTVALWVDRKDRQEKELAQSRGWGGGWGREVKQERN